MGECWRQCDDVTRRDLPTCAPPRGHISSHREASIAHKSDNHVAQEEAGVGFSHHAAVFPPPLRNAGCHNSRHNCRRVCNPQQSLISEGIAGYDNGVRSSYVNACAGRDDLPARHERLHAGPRL